MKNPNGYGSVYKKSGNRRRPWVARKTAGWNEKGQPIYNYIGYYATKREAIEGLALYNAKPYDTRATFGECAKRWYEQAEHQMSESTRRITIAQMKRCAPLNNKKIAEIKLADMQPIVSAVSKSVGKQVKAYLSKVFDYAVRNEIITADRHQNVSYIKLSDNEGNTIERKVFSREEIERVSDPLVLILLYTGLRVGELLDLRPEDIHLEERWLYVRKAKTPSGIRVVPIAERIVPCFSSLPADITYERFKRHFRNAYNGHLPHDTRHTFISLCADNHIDERVTKAIVGHAGSGITETVYTHIDLSVLLEAVNRL